jgi:superfamily II DNA or RNA helicase/predicted house-cleaning noncanonical NTP pyrophosphatase (MazG superfamily)/HKD family nuclease
LNPSGSAAWHCSRISSQVEMTENKDTPPIIYKKLVRDRIPEIIRGHRKRPFARTLDEGDFNEALGVKILEEAHELFSEWKKGSKDGILKESADMLEVLLTMLSRYGLTVEDLVNERKKRRDERGGFEEKSFLESVNGEASPWLSDGLPAMVCAGEDSACLINAVRSELERSDQAFIASAFFSPGVMNLFNADFRRFIERGGELHLILSTMGTITRPEHFLLLRDMLPGSVRIFHPPDIPYDTKPPDFHVKVYLFRNRDGKGSMIIGSSNLTERGFGKNIEWNYFSAGEVNVCFRVESAYQVACGAFARYWDEQSVGITDEFIEAYRRRFKMRPPSLEEVFQAPAVYRPAIRPNAVQIGALESLMRMRSEGVTRAAVVAATGTGKTYLSAFDFKECGYETLLFIAHRETILSKARESFATVMGESFEGEIYGGGRKDAEKGKPLFAMVQTLGLTANLEGFAEDAFDYIVVDEFHHGTADTYRRVLDHFRPRFLLGLTATPERMDGRDVLELCDYNVASEVRLLEAIDRGWLTPFQYFAIYDETDYEQIPWRTTHYDEEELSRALSSDTRTAIVAKNLKSYLPSAGKIKALAFCSSTAHARYTARRLSEDYGIPSLSILGEMPEVEREALLARLRRDDDPLEVICCVDVFNEGVDIPELSHVLLLRPTQSFTVFLQQLGRGLRKAEGKDFLVALDFVGNFRKAYVAPLALQGYTSISGFMEERGVRWGGFRGFDAALPRGCYVSPDTKVIRIWDEEIRGILKGVSREDMLRALYAEIRGDLESVPTLADLLVSPYDVDPFAFIKQFGNWLRAKLACEGRLTDYEMSVLDTPGEKFLAHLEKELKPNKSYKMVVLTVLLRLPGTRWKVSDIAKGFLAYYMEHRDRLSDYEELAKAAKPEVFPLKKVKEHIKKMPLHFLSNTEQDWFVLDKGRDEFGCKEEIAACWEDERFRELVADRVEFGMNRYFMRMHRKVTVMVGEAELREGIRLERGFVVMLQGQSPLRAGEKKEIGVRWDKVKEKGELARSQDGRVYRLRLRDEGEIWKAIVEKMGEGKIKVELSVEGDGVRVRF